MQLTEEERYQRSKASYERNGWIVEDDNKKPGKICPVIQRACIKEQCLAYIISGFFDGERDQMCYKCSILNVVLG